MAFIERAKDKDSGLKGAFYEFQWPIVLNALHDAKTRGAAVDIVFDDIDGDTGRTVRMRMQSSWPQLKTVCTAHERHVDAQQIPRPDGDR